MPQEEIVIRPFNPADKSKVEEICCDTAFMGQPVDVFFADRKIFADFALKYYIDYEAESFFVAEDKKGIVGYIAGCKDTLKYRRIFNRRILPRLVSKAIFRGTFFRIKNLRLLINLLKSFLKGELRRFECIKDFPAHLHINVIGGRRHAGVGTNLMERYLRYLRESQVAGLHLYSFSPSGREFFKKTGFSEVFSQRVSYFDHLNLPEVRLSCFVKKLI